MSPDTFYSPETLKDHPAQFQSKVPNKPRGWIYWLNGKKFDAYRNATGELVDAKSSSGKDFYVRALTDPSLCKGLQKSGKYTGLLEDLVSQLNIAIEVGKRFIIEVETKEMEAAFKETLKLESQKGYPDLRTIPVQVHQ